MNGRIDSKRLAYSFTVETCFNAPNSVTAVRIVFPAADWSGDDGGRKIRSDTIDARYRGSERKLN